MHVVVVGGGPAGSVTALALARRGVRVTLCDARSFPRHRPGESMPPAIEPLLGQLGLAESLAAADFPRTAGVELSWNGRRHRRAAGADHRGEWRSFQADRARFDTLLLHAAAAAGVTVRERAHVAGLLRQGGRVTGVQQGGEDIPADFVVDAAGGSHWLARQLGIGLETRSRRLLARYGYCRSAPGRHPPEPHLASDDTGWIWLAPLEHHRVAWVRLRWDGGLESAHWRPAELAEAEPVDRARSADVTWRQVRAPAGPGYFCVGDAAFVVDPLSSHGVLRAIMSGMQAAYLMGLCAEGLPASRAASEFHRWIAAWFEHETASLRAIYAETGHQVGLPLWAPPPTPAPPGAGG